MRFAFQFNYGPFHWGLISCLYTLTLYDTIIVYYCGIVIACITERSSSFKPSYFFSLISASWNRAITYLNAWMDLAPATSFLISLFNKCQMNKNDHLTSYSSGVSAQCMNYKSKETLNIFCRISWSTWDLKLIPVAECILVATGLNTWHVLFNWFPI